MPDLQPIAAIPDVPPRPADAHKGTFGTVIIVGGCDTMIGAPALCAAAALRSGTGLVKIAAPANVLTAALTIEPGATGILIGDDVKTTLHQLDKADPDHTAILAVGPGLGQSEGAAELVDALLQGPRAIVLDADGLNLLAHSTLTLESIRNPQSAIRNLPSLVLTPHPGEFRRLAARAHVTESPTDRLQRPVAAAKLAEAFRAIVLLKGQYTIASDGSRVFTNATGNPALATAGSGDVLTGIIASLLAQRMQAFDAAVLAAHLHGLAADMWSQVHGTSGLTARDLATILPDAFNVHRTEPR
ncbi:MAG: NAD(P)H-hydrate dehydratase [Phycisphaeraceae bacterium]